MDQYSYDLQTILNENDHQLEENFVIELMRQILYSLEYIHSKVCAHADIKGSN
jgi:serine/threonine protein kinase